MSGVSPKRGRGRPRSIDRDAVVHAALAAWWREGPAGLSLNGLCKEVGISKPALYREFGGEDGLMDVALAAYRELAVVPLLSLLASDLAFGAVLDRAVLALSQDRGLPAGCLFTEMRRAPERVGTETASRLAGLVDERRAAFAQAWSRAQDRGEVRADLDPGFAARYIDTQLTALLQQMRDGEPVDGVRAQARLALGALLAR